MSIITAIGSDGESLIYLEGIGDGTAESPFIPKHVIESGQLQIKGKVSNRTALPTYTQGQQVDLQADINGVLYVNQNKLSESTDRVRSYQGGDWTVRQGGDWTVNLHPSSIIVDPAKGEKQSRIPGLDIPKHNHIQIVTDSNDELVSVTYRLDGVIVSTLNFTYSNYLFVGPNKTTVIEKS